MARQFENGHFNLEEFINSPLNFDFCLDLSYKYEWTAEEKQNSIDYYNFEEIRGNVRP